MKEVGALTQITNLFLIALTLAILVIGVLLSGDFIVVDDVWSISETMGFILMLCSIGLAQLWLNVYLYRRILELKNEIREIIKEGE